MKSALAALALASSAHATMLTADYVEANHNALFASFKHAYSRNYTTAGEEAARKQVFKTNMLKAAEVQARNPRATFGATRFSDMSDEEVYPFLHGVPHTAAAQPDFPPLFTDDQVAAALATGVDWRDKGAVAPIQDQGDCGSCWAFSIIGAAEGANFLHGTGKLVKLSEQEPLVCIIGMGCAGGMPRDAIEYLENKLDGQLATEATYPYQGTGHHQNCQIGVNASVEIGATISGYAEIAKSEAQIATYLVTNGPVSVVVSAVGWTSYTGGVMDNCDGGFLDHAVLAVGVTEDYWIVKNSWGAQWGESGYIRLAYGKNICMINEMPNCPTM